MNITLARSAPDATLTGAFADHALYGGTPLSPCDVAVVNALSARMQSEPRYLHEAVRGSCEWQDSFDAENLWAEAVDHLADMIDEAKLFGTPTNTHRILALIAAINAAMWLVDVQKEQRLAEDDAWENGRAWNPNGGQ